MRVITSTLTALLLAAGAAAASDDMTVVSKTTHDGKPSGNTTSYLSADHARMGTSGGRETIIDVKTGTMTMLDGSKKTYYTVTKKDMDALNAKMRERMNSPDAKKGMDLMQGMTAGMADSYEVKKTGQTRKVAGYTCEEWTITMSEMSTTRECVTSEVKYPAHAYDAFKAFSQSMTGSSPFAPTAKSTDTMAEKRKAMKGFPVSTSITTDIMGTKSTTDSEVVEISYAAIPSTTWDVPAGYAKVDNPMLKAMDRHRAHN
jgi:hypothetical protein